MRTVTPQADALLQQNLGTEIMVLVEVEWVEGNYTLYSDQDLAGARPVIVSLGGFDTSMMLSGASDSQELSVTLDDIDGHLRAIYNAQDMHKRNARVYIMHKSLDISHKILLFQGEVVTPLTWDEAQRTMSFNIMSKLHSQQVGFSMEEGDFPNIPEEALGEVWPLVFGQVCHLPAVRVRAPRRGYLETGVGIHDFTIAPRICQAVNIQCPSQSTGNQNFATQGAGNTWTVNNAKTIGPDLECVNRRFGEICKLRDLLAQQMVYETSPVTIYNGSSFPQGESVDLFVDNAILTGTFSGNIFTIESRVHPELEDFDMPVCQAVQTLAYGSVQGRPAIGGPASVTQPSGGYWAITEKGAGRRATAAVWIPGDGSTTFYADQSEAQAQASCDEALQSTPGMVGGPKESWELYNAMNASDFFWAPAGSEVYMEAESEILYIASLLPGTVDSVSAYRTASNGFRYLTEVPASYYTVYETDYDGYDVVEIGMNKSLTLYDDAWEDQIYVSVTSTVGPNPCDTIQWLIEKYTDLTVDATTFASVHAYMTNYPQNFYLTDRPDVYDLIQDIAYQARCAVYIRNKVVYIKYLSLEPTSERTLTESDIVFGTFQESLSDTEEVYTTHNVQWQKAGAAVRADQSIERKLILKYNVDKYGTVEEDWDYYTYNIYELALKSATFWLIRKANSWKKLQFDVPIRHIDLDVLDCISIDVAQFSATAIKCIIEDAAFDPSKNTVRLTCWTPVRTGETEAYHWAWPSQQPAVGVWPLPLDTHGGGGYDFEVSPPLGHILLGGAHREDQIIITSGDLHPSDLDDTLPSVACETSDYVNFEETAPEIEAKEIAQSAANTAMENGMSGGGNAGGSSDKKKEIESCGDDGVGCNYKVNVTWHTSTSQGRANATGGPWCAGSAGHDADNCGGPCQCAGGCPSCTGPLWVVCHTFSTTWGALMFASYMEAEYGNNCWWDCNETRVYSVGAKNGTFHEPSCQSIYTAESGESDGSEPTSETGEPTGLTGAEPI